MFPNRTYANCSGLAGAFDRRQPVYVDQFGRLMPDHTAQQVRQIRPDEPLTQVLPNTWGAGAIQ